MADAVVEFLLENLKHLLLNNINLVSKVKDQVESLYRELSLMKAFLIDSKEKRNEYEYVRELVRQIRDVAYEAEDIIDTFVVNATMQKQRNPVSRFIHVFDHTTMLRNVAKQIESIRTKIKEIYDKKMFGIVARQGGEPLNKGKEKKRAPVVEEDNVVGFDEEAQTVITRLTKGTERLEVVSIVGMGGLGKTTLGKKLYVDTSVEYHFYIRVWIYVSQEYSRREVFLHVLDSLSLTTDQMYKMNDERLAEELCGHLRGGRYLIVIDDVWTKEAWNELKMAFPDTGCGSRILLTTRHTDVAVHANPYSPPHHLRFLTDSESWELLCKKVFRKENCPLELEDLGKQIARKCYGLPLAIVVVAGLLLKKEKLRDWWRKVAESVSAYVARDPAQCMNVLALSYNHLPDHLKVCFIYFGIFPEDFEIPVQKLIRLWVAEGFVPQTGRECMEDIAEEYLEDLVDRNLILVAKKRLNGRIKSCRIHDMLRDLCLREAEDEKFLQVIQVHTQNSRQFTNYYRRLCIHSDVLAYIRSKPSGPHVRCFLCFPLEEIELGREHMSFVHEAFKLVRVLDIRSINLPRFPSEITQLVLLRYLAFYGNFKIVPASVSTLWNLQTLVVETTSRTLDIQADIWKMLLFRHLYTSGLTRLEGPPAKARKASEDPFVRRGIQTISAILPESCTENVLARMPSLKKLGIRGKLITLVEENGGHRLFDNLAKLDNLETLKLLNNTFPRPPMEGKLPGVPQWYTFPPNLKKLTLSDTLLDWKHMSTLGMLPNLEVLKLKEKAFEGTSWEPLDGGFQMLRVLQLGRSDLVHWQASGHHFPRLQRVILRHCTSLEAVPSGLGDVSTLQNMELYWPTRSAATSARYIELKQRSMNSGFKLLIYPPDLQLC